MNKMFLIFCAFLSLCIQSGFASYELEINNEQKVIDRHYYNFGSVKVNSMNSISFKVRNTGTEKLTFKRATISGFDFSASHTCKNGLEPEAKCAFTISYWPMFEGLASGQFVLNFVEDSHIVVDLFGTSIK